MRIRNSGYSEHGASRQRTALLNWHAITKSPHEDISRNLELLRARSRDLYAGSPLGRGAIDRLVLNAIGSGLKLNVRIDPEILGMSPEYSREWASTVEAEFDYWASKKTCDVQGTMNFYDLQVLAFRTVLIDGEALAILTDINAKNSPYKLRVGLISPDRLETPPNRPTGTQIDAGIELDSNGIPIAYYIANRVPKSELMNQPLLKYKRIPIYGESSHRRNILHLLPCERIGQHRGVPFLAPVIEQLKQLSRYTDAELMAAVISGMYAIFFEHAQSKTEDGEYIEEDYASEQGQGEAPGLEETSELKKISQQQMYGTVIDLPEGVKATSLSPNRPNQNFDAFVNSLVRQIGGALGLPAELLFLQFTASYSASRGALLEAWKLFKYWRTWLANNFCQPIYEEFLTEAVLSGRIEAPKYFTDNFLRFAYSWAEWTGPSQGQLNPVQEVQASILKVEHGFSTHERETGELTGSDFDLNVRQIERERSLINANVQDTE